MNILLKVGEKKLISLAIARIECVMTTQFHVTERYFVQKVSENKYCVLKTYVVNA